jgi:hypothetical protein
MNCALSAKFRGEPIRPLVASVPKRFKNYAASGIATKGAPTVKAPLKLLALGSFGWYRYLRDSRIVQRVKSRHKVQRLATV